MAILIDYIWQSSFSLLVFYGVYLVLLRKEKAFTATRAYLLLTPIIALICPLISIPVEFSKPGISLNQTEFFRALSEKEAPEVFIATYGLPEVTIQDTRLPLILEIKDYLFIGYFVIALILLLKLIWALIQIRTLYQRGWFQASYDIPNKCLVIPTFGQSPVFSFLNHLFWDDTAALNKHESAMIYGHELVHIHQKHSWDILYFQCLSVLFWFNPIIHLMRNAISETHEYLADEAIVKRNQEPHSYMKLIAAQAIVGIDFSVGSHFAKSLTRSRIQMIKSQKNASIVKMIAVVPISILLMGLISLRAPEEIQHFPDKLTSTIDVIKNKLISSKDSLPVGIRMVQMSNPEHFELIGELKGDKMEVQIGMFSYTFEGIRNEDDYRRVRKLIQKLRENSLVPMDVDILRRSAPADQTAFYPGKSGEWEEYFLDRIALPEREMKMGLGGIMEIEFIVDKQGIVSEPIIKKSIGGGLDSQVLAIFDNPDLPKWSPATYQNEPVRSVQSVSFGIYPSSY